MSNEDPWGVPPNMRRDWQNHYLGEPDPRPVIDDRVCYALEGMLARTRGVGKTHELATFIQSAHMSDGYMICFNHREAQRVKKAYGIITAAVTDLHSSVMHNPSFIPFVDPECLGALGAHMIKEIQEQQDHYLRRIKSIEAHTQEWRNKASGYQVQVWELRQEAREKDAILHFILWATGNLPCTNVPTKDI